MFTGIIREAGQVADLDRGEDGAVLTVRAPATRPSLALGGSVAVDGVCLTVTDLTADGFTVQIVPETLRRTRLSGLQIGERVNLELPLKIGDPLDGHLVQGHVDGVGEVSASRVEGIGRWITIRPPGNLVPFLAEKGSVAVNGVSLTIAAATAADFAIALIPTTLELTNLKDLQEGSHVNLEVDLLARYVARLAGAR